MGYYLITLETIVTCLLTAGLTLYWYFTYRDDENWQGGGMDFILLAFAVTSPISAAIGMAYQVRCHPIQPDFFADKVILDAGCGMGRFSMISSQFGAKHVFAIDASDAVEAARQNAQSFDNVHVIQGDINRLPLRKNGNGQIDFAFSIGVLHHLDDPKAGFTAITKHLKPDGSIFAWVYGRENNGWIVHGLNPVRTALTSRLPRGVLYGLSWGVTAVLHPILKLAYNPDGMLSGLRGFLPYRDYLAWLSQYSFRHNHHVVFDHLVAPVAFYIHQDEFKQWFRDANLDVISMTWRNRNSWRGHGKPA